MLLVALNYRAVINDITANKVLKLHRYKLDDVDWDIVKDLLKVLKAHRAVLCLLISSHCHPRCTKMPHYFSLKTISSLLLMLYQLWTGLTRCLAVPP